MKCQYQALAATLSIFLGAAALAQESPVPTIQTQTKAIISAVKKFSESISCTGAAPEPQYIAAMIPYKNVDARLESKFAVIYHGDIGCAGGSGTSGAAIAVVRIGAGDTFYVSPKESSPVVDDELPRIVERVVGATSDSITIDAKTYGKDDPNCCPSIRQRITLRQMPNGSWVTISSKLLPPAKN